MMTNTDALAGASESNDAYPKKDIQDNSTKSKSNSIKKEHENDDDDGFDDD